ncbi:MAG: HAMP domain-containing histidine kinase [Cyanobacteria bacterium]|nr:HAMP domain-containing histidine kinase [Cyanobacteriota bacterium]
MINLRLRHVGWILLGVPLVSQIIIGAVLIHTLLGLERAAKKETTAKKIISIVEDLHLELAHSVQVGLVGGYSAKLQYGSFRRSVQGELTKLRHLTADDKNAKVAVSDYEKCTLRALSLLDDVVQYNEGVCFTRHANQAEFVEEISWFIREAFRCEDKLFGHYFPVVEEFQPKFVAERQRIRAWIMVAITTNTLLVVALASVYGIGIVSRLNLLMENIRRFSKGKTDLHVVGGRDELTELDSSFRKMAASRDRAQRVQRDLYAMVNHDLSSPLSSVEVTLSSILLTESKELDDALIKKLRRMRSVVLLLLRMTESFLDLERSTLGKLELRLQKASPGKIVATAVDAVQGSAESKNISVLTDIRVVSKTSNIETNADDETIVCDPDRVTQVIVNLLSNAVKYSPRGSTINVVLIIDPDSSCRFEVRDQGRGFTESQKVKLFRRFSQLDPTQDSKIGTGLGLYICRLMIEAHQGKIGAEAIPEGGSVFWVELPQEGLAPMDESTQRQENGK